MSEHEGFCIPLTEAFHFGVPVIARPFGAVPEVCGDAAILVPDSDPAVIAELLHVLHGDAELRAELRRRGHERLAAFEPGVIAQRLRAAVEAVATSPRGCRRPRPKPPGSPALSPAGAAASAGLPSRRWRSPEPITIAVVALAAGALALYIHAHHLQWRPGHGARDRRQPGAVRGLWRRAGVPADPGPVARGVRADLLAACSARGRGALVLTGRRSASPHDAAARRASG